MVLLVLFVCSWFPMLRAGTQFVALCAGGSGVSLLIPRGTWNEWDECSWFPMLRGEPVLWRFALVDAERLLLIPRRAWNEWKCRTRRIAPDGNYIGCGIPDISDSTRSAWEPRWQRSALVDANFLCELICKLSPKGVANEHTDSASHQSRSQ